MAFNTNIQGFIDAVNKLSDADRVAFSELIFREFVEASDITRYHNIVTGAKCNTPIPFANTEQNWDWGKNGASRSSNCDEITADIGATFSTKTWTTATYTNAVELCFKDIDCKIKDYFQSERCNDEDPSGSLYLEFLLELITQALAKSWWTKTYFAATTSSNTALSGHNGIFTQMLAVATSAAHPQRIEITANGQATYALQNTLAATVGLDTYRSMVEAAEFNTQLQNRDDLEIRSTRVLALNYLKWLRDQKQVTCCERDPLTGTYTLDNLSMFGTPIRVVDEWDKIIRDTRSGTPVFSDLNTGTAWVNPHRAILSYVGNEPIGTCQEDELGELDFRLDMYNKNFKVSTEYDFDAKVLQDEDFILAM